MSPYCPKCGKDVSEEDVFCSRCGMRLKALPIKDVGFSIAGGVLGIIVASICMFVGMIGIAYHTIPYFRPHVGMLLVGPAGLIGLAFGLMGGILVLKRRHVALSVVGISFTTLSGIIIALATLAEPYTFICLVFGVPVIVLSILSLALIFTAVFKGKFA